MDEKTNQPTEKKVLIKKPLSTKKPFFFRLEGCLLDRAITQMKRLGMGKASWARMAFVKLVEEQEREQREQGQ